MTLANNTVGILLPTRNPSAAQAFYTDCLGLPFVGKSADGELVFQLAGGARLLLRELPDSAPSPNTEMTFAVDDIAAAITDLEGHGVAFEDYDAPGLRTVNHVFHSGTTKAAWFRDPDGNVLCLHQAG